jgi:hypothetical protein
VAATDNVFAAATNTESDMFFQVRPGILLSHDAPRLIQVYTAEAEVLEYVNHSDKPSVTYRAGWKGNFLVTPLVDVFAAANASTGTLNVLSARGTPDQPITSIVPVGNTTVNQADASEIFVRRFGKDWRVREGLAGRWAGTQDDTDAQTSAVDADLSLGAERDFDKNAFSLTLDVDFVRLRRFTPDPVPPPVPPVVNPNGNRLDRQLNPRATLLWRHDYNRFFSSSVSVGAITLNPIGVDPFNPMDQHRPAGLYTLAAAQVAYTDLWGRAQLNVARTVAPDLFIAQTTLNTTATASLALPLPWFDDNHRLPPKLVALGSATYLQSEVINTAQVQGTLAQGTFNAARLALGVTYSPYPNQTYGLRYELAYQAGNVQAQMLIPSFSTNTVFFTFLFRYPERLAVDLPPQNETTRADRTDITPMSDTPPKEDDNSNGVIGGHKDE